MFKKTITFEDFEGNLRTEDHYFNMSNAEWAELSLIHSTVDTPKDQNAYALFLKAEMASGDGARIISVMKDMVFRSYGIKGDDGKTFRKGPEISKAFSETGAYDVFFMELVTDPDASILFVNGVAPKEGGAPAQTGQSPQEIARARSEAMMQGHQSQRVPEPQTIQVPSAPVAATPTPEQIKAYLDYQQSQGTANPIQQ